MTFPTILNIKRRNGVAGQFAYDATIQYPNEGPETITLVGSVYGGRVVMVASNGQQVVVSPEVMDRCGNTLSPNWVRKFFGCACGDSDVYDGYAECEVHPS